MTRFNFRLQKVLEMRERDAQTAAQLLTQAQQRADDARSAHDALASIRQAGSAQMAAAHGGLATVGQLQNISFLLERIDHRVSQAADAADVAASGVDTARAELTEAHQARRAIDRLRERRLEDFNQMMAQTDRQLMDSLALSLFSRNRSSLSDDT